VDIPATQAATARVDADSLAAVAAASLGRARRMSAELRIGVLHEALTRAAAGYAAAATIGLLALVGAGRGRRRPAVPGERATIENLGQLLAEARPEQAAASWPGRWPSFAAAGRDWLAFSRGKRARTAARPPG
jgi:hypothetical protein